MVDKTTQILLSYTLIVLLGLFIFPPSLDDESSIGFLILFLGFAKKNGPHSNLQLKDQPTENPLLNRPQEGYPAPEDPQPPSQKTWPESVVRQMSQLSPQGNLQMASHLRNKVRKLMGEEDGKPPRYPTFVPATELRDLLKDEAEPVLEKIITKARNASKGGSDVPTLMQLNDFVLDKACKIFGILLLQSRPDRIITFYNDKFGDEMLPVRPKKVSLDDDVSGTIESCKGADGSGVELKDFWLEAEAEAFPQRQWPFLARVFERDTFEYTIEEMETLPLTKGPKKLKDDRERNYSWVNEWSVHKDYVTFMEPEDASFDDQGNYRVAIKQLKDPKSDMIKREVNGLKIMRDADHDHLVKATAYYKYKDGHFFMFPFTEQGNLWEFWTNKANVPILDRPYLTWVFAQLTGLARGIERLHHPPSGDILRHTDLKPENILCFKAKEKIEGNGILNSRLVITDLGLANTHNTSTQNRPSTNTIVSTTRYLAPEMETNTGGALGRRFDIWSMGCLFLEFTIWVLYGAVELERCTSENREFFELHETSEKDGRNDGLLKVPTTTPTKGKWASRHSVVDDWIKYLKADWRCSEKTALGKLVKLIDEWMLVVKVEELEAPPQSVNRRTTSLEKATVAKPADYSRKQGYRTYAPAMVKDLKEILTGLEENKIEAIGKKLHPGADTPKGPSKVTSRGVGVGVAVGAPYVVVLRPV